MESGSHALDGGGEVNSRGPATDFAAVAADERLGSYGAATLAGRACAPANCMRAVLECASYVRTLPLAARAKQQSIVRLQAVPTRWMRGQVMPMLGNDGLPQTCLDVCQEHEGASYARTAVPLH